MIWPPEGMRTPAMTLAMVLFPPPFGPVMTTKRFLGMEKLTSFKISTWPASSSTSKRIFFSSSMMIVSLLSYHEKVESEKWKVKIYVTVEHGLSIMFGYKTVGADNIRPPLPDITNAGKINKRIMLREAGYIRKPHKSEKTGTTEQIQIYFV